MRAPWLVKSRRIDIPGLWYRTVRRKQAHNKCGNKTSAMILESKISEKWCCLNF